MSERRWYFHRSRNSGSERAKAVATVTITHPAEQEPKAGHCEGEA
ncbi:hypothetical protein ABGV42_05085 [Paenibacillus pabuli]